MEPTAVLSLRTETFGKVIVCACVSVNKPSSQQAFRTTNALFIIIIVHFLFFAVFLLMFFRGSRFPWHLMEIVNLLILNENQRNLQRNFSRRCMRINGSKYGSNLIWATRFLIPKWTADIILSFSVRALNKIYTKNSIILQLFPFFILTICPHAFSCQTIKIGLFHCFITIVLSSETLMLQSFELWFIILCADSHSS